MRPGEPGGPAAGWCSETCGWPWDRRKSEWAWGHLAGLGFIRAQLHMGFVMSADDSDSSGGGLIMMVKMMMMW